MPDDVVSAQAATYGGPFPGYSATDAVAYAKKWTKPTSKTDEPRNGAYPFYGDYDCTNFVSQAMRAGGWTEAPAQSWEVNQTNVWESYISSGYTSSTWRRVPYFNRFAVKRSSYLSNKYSTKLGDVLTLDYTGDAEPDHAMVVTGTKDGKPKVSYHSSWAYNVPLVDQIPLFKRNAEQWAEKNNKPVPALKWFAFRMSS